MTDIETLKNILHRENLKEDDKHVGIPSWNKDYDEFCHSLGYHDLTTSNPKNITTWKELQRIKREPDLDRQRAFFLRESQKLLLRGSMYPFAVLIFLSIIVNL